MYNSDKDVWIDGPPNILKAYERYSESVSISYSMVSGMIYLSYEHISPIFAYTMCKLIIDELNNVSRGKAKMRLTYH